MKLTGQEGTGTIQKKEKDVIKSNLKYAILKIDF